MSIKIIEIKARSTDPDKIRSILKSRAAQFIGEDHQVDTYFKVNRGRLKLREGNIENHLIQYNRQNQVGPKLSKVQLYKPSQDSSLKKILTNSLGILTIVDKKREIYYIENVKFHIDEVKGLGSFIEIEAIDETDQYSEEELRKQCKKFLDLFEVKEKDLVSNSYSDMILAK